MSTSQEKLEQRAVAICPYALRNPESHKPSPKGICIVCHHAIEFARAELQKAAEIADDYQRSVGIGKPRNIAAEIRKLME